MQYNYTCNTLKGRVKNIAMVMVKITYASWG